MLVCPDCGHGQFEQRVVAEIREVFTLDDLGGRDVIDSNDIVSVDDISDDFQCGDCGRALWDTDLVTEDEYSDED